MDPAIVIPVLTACISFVAAVGAVVLGQYLGQRGQRQADEARWRREDTLRRRTRSEETARAALEALVQATDLMGWAAGHARGGVTTGTNVYREADIEEVTALCRPVRRAALEVDDREVRAHLEKVCDLLPNAAAARLFGAPHPARLAWAAQLYTDAMISAYLRGDKLPVPPPATLSSAIAAFLGGYSALEDLWAEYESANEPEAD